MGKAQIPDEAIENLWKRMDKGLKSWPELIGNRFLKTEHQENLLTLIHARAKQINLDF